VDVYLIVLRVLHIGAAVFWVGSFFLFFGFIEPTAKALGPGAGPFMGHMTGKRKLPIALAIASTLAVLTGALLLWDRSGGFSGAYFGTGTGLTFLLGGITATIAWLVGLVAVRPAVERMGAVGAEVQASGGPPSEDQAAELERLTHRLGLLGRVDAVLLGFTVLAMATARYL
jgi:uncharacterized membrane protein